MAVQATRGRLAKQVHEEGLEFGDRVLWRKHRSNDTKRGVGCPVDGGSVAWSTVGVQPIIAFRVLCNADHWQKRWCRELLGNTRAVSVEEPGALFDEVLPVVLLPLPDVEPAARIPVQPEFDPRRVYIRPIVGDACR